jgi:hypothetical protein
MLSNKLHARGNLLGWLNTEADLETGKDALAVAGLDLDVKVTGGQEAKDGVLGINQVQQNILNNNVTLATKYHNIEFNFIFMNLF